MEGHFGSNGLGLVFFCSIDSTFHQLPKQVITMGNHFASFVCDIGLTLTHSSLKRALFLFPFYTWKTTMLKIAQLMNHRTKSRTSPDSGTQQSVLLSTILLWCWPPSPSSVLISDNVVAKFNGHFQPSISQMTLVKYDVPSVPVW